jgi:hypothetical protein
MLDGMDVWTVGCSRNIVRSAFLFRSLPLIGSNVSLLLPGKAARLSPIIDCAPEPRVTQREHARHRRVIGEYRHRDAPRSGGSEPRRTVDTCARAEAIRSFDVVSSTEVLEHVDNPAALLRSCAELVKVRLLAALPLTRILILIDM